MSDTEITQHKPTGGLRKMRLAWQLPVLLLAVLAWVLFIDANRKKHVPGKVTDTEMLTALAEDFKQGRLRVVVGDAQRFLKAFPGHDEEASVRSWLGRSAFHLAESEPDQSEQLEETAVKNMGLALEKGLDGPDAVETRKALVQIHTKRQDYAQARPLAEQLAQDDPESAVRLLTELGRQCFATDRSSQGEEILKQALTLATTVEQKVQVALVLARGLRSSGAAPRAEKLLAQIQDQGSDHPWVNEVQFELARALADQRKFEKARETFVKVVNSESGGSELSLASRFHAADCALGQGEAAQAEREFLAIATTFEGTGECVGARMRLARIYLNSARWESARSELSRMLSEFENGQKLVNPYADDAELRTMWNEVLQHFLRKGELGQAREFITEGVRLGQKDVLLYSEGLTYQQESDALMEKAGHLQVRGLDYEAGQLRRQARKLRLRAAKYFLRIVNSSEMARSQLFGKALWRAANCFYESGDYARAAVYYGLFHASADNDEQRGRARMQHGRAMAALGSHKEAIENFESVLTEFPGTLHACEARYEKALSLVALGQLKEARTAFNEIVQDQEQLTTKAKIWRQSLPMLGYLNYRSGDCEAAVKTLDEALVRELPMPDSELGTAEIGFYLAESLRRIPADNPTVRKENLARAAGLYATFIKSTQDIRRPDERVLQMRRTSLFNRAGCLFDLGRFGEAASAYRLVSERYPRTPEAVTALHRMVTCYEELRLPREANGARKLAQWTAANLADAKADKDATLASYWSALDRYRSLNRKRDVAGQGVHSHD